MPKPTVRIYDEGTRFEVIMLDGHYVSRHVSKMKGSELQKKWKLAGSQEKYPYIPKRPPNFDPEKEYYVRDHIMASLNLRMLVSEFEDFSNWVAVSGPSLGLKLGGLK